MEQNKLPAGWSWVKLGEVSEINSGIGFPKKHQGKKNEKYPFFKVGDISNNVREGKRYLEVYDNSISEDDLWEIKGRITEPHSVVFAKIGEALKLNRRAITKENCLVDNNVMSVKVLESKLNYIYLYYFLLVQNLGELSRSTTVPSIRKSDVENILIPLPPLIEQQKIVDKIEELFSELDNGIANLKKAKEQIKVYKQSVLKYAFEGKLVKGKMQNGKGKSENDGLPEGWKYVKMEDVCIKIQDGSHYSPQKKYPSNDGTKFLYITSKNIRNNFLDLRNVEYVDKDFHCTIFPRCNPEYGDVLLTKDGANTGNVTLNTLREEFSLLSSVCLIKPEISTLIPSYLKYYIQSPIGFKEITGAMTGTAIKRIILKNIKIAEIPIPTIDLQTQIVEEIERRFSVADKMEAVINESLKKAEGLRQSILKQAFEGKLV